MAYIGSGAFAAAVDVGSYFLLLQLGVWYIGANIIGGVLGFFAAFLLNKYIVFQKKNAFGRHLIRYFLVDMINVAILSVFLYLLVDFGSMDQGMAKFVAYAPVILWNFFVYKFVVYV